MESEHDKSEIVSPSLLPQEYEMEYVRNFFDSRFAFLGSEWLPRNGVSLETELQELDNIDTMAKLPGESSKHSSEPESKKPRLSLSLKRKKADADRPMLKDSTNTLHRFGFPKAEKEVSKAAKGVTPMNTANNSHWGENNFLTWATEHNKHAHVLDDEVPLDLLESHDADLVNKHLSFCT